MKEVEKGIKKQEEETAEFRPEIIHPETGSIISERSIEEELKEGEVYQLAFLNIDIVGSGKIARKYLEKKQLLLTNYHKFITNIVKSYNGDLFSWAGNGGIIAFWGEEAPNNAVLTGVKITQDLTVFNLDRKLNPHFLIALETLRYINLNNIGTILHFRSINSVLLGRLLDNEQLFRKPTNISLALNHPKCNLKFAHKNTRVLGNIELKKIAQNPNSNPEVRNYIKSKLQRKG